MHEGPDIRVACYAGARPQAELHVSEMASPLSNECSVAYHLGKFCESEK